MSLSRGDLKPVLKIPETGQEKNMMEFIVSIVASLNSFEESQANDVLV